MPLRAIPSLVQRLARRIEAQHAAAACDVRHDHYFRLVGVDRRNLLTQPRKGFPHALAHLGDDLLRRQPATLVTRAFDHEAVACVEPFGPVQATHLRMQHRRRVCRHFAEDAQDAACCAQAQVQLVELAWRRSEQHGTKRRRQPGGAQRLQLGDEGRLGLVGTGRDQPHEWLRTPHRRRRILICCLSRDENSRRGRRPRRAIRGDHLPCGKSRPWPVRSGTPAPVPSGLPSRTSCASRRGRRT